MSFSMGALVGDAVGFPFFLEGAEDEACELECFRLAIMIT